MLHFSALRYFRPYGFRPSGGIFRPYRFYIFGLLVSILRTRPQKTRFLSQKSWICDVLIGLLLLFAYQSALPSCLHLDRADPEPRNCITVIAFYQRPKIVLVTMCKLGQGQVRLVKKRLLINFDNIVYTFSTLVSALGPRTS